MRIHITHISLIYERDERHRAQVKKFYDMEI